MHLVQPMSELNWLNDWPGIRVDEPLAKHSQYGIGGPADWFVQVSERDQLADLLRRCAAESIPVTVIGAGSNTLILDGGIRGVVVELTDKTMRAIDADTVELAAACMMPRAALDCAKLGLSGLEFGLGVPGTCGASVRGNAGAFGREIKDVLIDCDVLDGTGGLHTFAVNECQFGYRSSLFKRDLPGSIVVAARFRVEHDDAAAVRARTDAIQTQRKATQPYGIRSLGSVFANPANDHAGRLIEACELKGIRHGGAEISTKHANFIVNVAAATAADVLNLVVLAHDTVLTRFGVDLEREIVVMGEDVTVTSGLEQGSA